MNSVLTTRTRVRMEVEMATTIEMTEDETGVGEDEDNSSPSNSRHGATTNNTASAMRLYRTVRTRQMRFMGLGAAKLAMSMRQTPSSHLPRS